MDEIGVTANSGPSVHDVLFEMIANGELSPGSWLRELTIAERLGVSRTPVREALKRLSAEGFVELSPNRGAQVVSPTVEDVRAVFDLRVLLEPRAVELAVPLLTESDLEELKGLHQEMMRLAAGSRAEIETIPILNNQFHGVFLERCGNELLSSTLRRAIRPVLVSRAYYLYSDAALSRSMHHHEEILEAAVMADGESAAAMMKAHVLAARRVLLNSPAPENN